MAYEILGENKGVQVVLRDAINAGVVEEINNAIAKSEQFDSLLYEVWDFLGVTSLQATLDDARQTAALDDAASLWRRGRTIPGAIIADNEEILSLVEEYLANIDESTYDARVFDNREDAEKWIASIVG